MEFVFKDSQYCCGRFRVHTYLQSKGIKETCIKPDRNNPKYYVWFYDRTPELKVALDEYFNKRR